MHKNVLKKKRKKCLRYHKSLINNHICIKMFEIKNKAGQRKSIISRYTNEVISKVANELIMNDQKRSLFEEVIVN